MRNTCEIRTVYKRVIPQARVEIIERILIEVENIVRVRPHAYYAYNIERWRKL